MVVCVCGVLSHHVDYRLHTHSCSGVNSGSFVFGGVLYQYLPSHAASCRLYVVSIATAVVIAVVVALVSGLAGLWFGRLNVVSIATAVIIAAIVIAVVVALVVCTMALVALLGV